MRSLTLLLLLTCTALYLFGCSGASGPAMEGTVPTPDPAQFDLAAPDGLLPILRQASYTEFDLIKLGRDYDSGFPHDNVNTNGSMVEFQGGGWAPGQGTNGLAYCMYGFAAEGYDRAPEVNFEWSVDPTDQDSVFVAFANWDDNRWDWYAANNPLSVSSFDPYLTDDKGELLLVVATIDSGAPVLDMLRLGPEPAITDWLHTWGGADQDFGIGTTSNGLDAVYVAGYCDSFGAGETDAMLARYSMEGTFQWARAWGSTDADEIRVVVVADDGQVYAVGNTYSYGTGGPSLLIQGWSENGMLTWARVWDPGHPTYNTGMAISGGFLYITGYTTLPAGDREVFVLKFDTAAKQVLWSKTLGLEFDDFAGGIVVTKSPEQTDVLHVAFDLGVDDGVDDVAYCQIGGDGTMLLQKQWQYADYDNFIQSLAVGPAGSPFIAGYINNAELGKELFVLEYSAEPGYLARSWYGDPTGNTTCDRVIFDSSGNLVVGGGISGVGSGGGLLATISTGGTLLGSAALVSSAAPVGFYYVDPGLPGRVLFTGPADAADNCTWEQPSLESNDHAGSWEDVTLNFAPISGTTIFDLPGSTVTDLNALGTQDSGGGDSDMLVGLAEAP